MLECILLSVEERRDYWRTSLLNRAWLVTDPKAPHRQHLLSPPVKEDRQSLVNVGDGAVLREWQAQGEILYQLNKATAEDSTLVLGMNRSYHATVRVPINLAFPCLFLRLTIATIKL